MMNKPPKAALKHSPVTVYFTTRRNTKGSYRSLKEKGHDPIAADSGVTAMGVTERPQTENKKLPEVC